MTTNGDTGLGLSFRRIFPVWRLASASGQSGDDAAAGGTPIAPRPLSGKRVLVVEDEFFVGIEIAETLEIEGAEIAGPVWTLADAERTAAQGGFDMAVLDVNLNGEYAIALGVELRKQGVRVVFATAHVDDDTLFAGDAASIPRIGKPISSRALLRALLPSS